LFFLLHIFVQFAFIICFTDMQVAC